MFELMTRDEIKQINHRLNLAEENILRLFENGGMLLGQIDKLIEETMNKKIEQSVFKEIKEENLCPICGSRLFYTYLPPRTEVEMLQDVRCSKMGWHCSKCDKYFEKQTNSMA